MLVSLCIASFNLLRQSDVGPCSVKVGPDTIHYDGMMPMVVSGWWRIPFAASRRLDGLFSLILLMLYPAWSWSQGQDVNYDARNYHLYSSLTFLAGGHADDLLPGGTQTFLNPLASLPAALLYYGSQLVGPLLPTLLFALLQGIALVVLYQLGLRLFQGNRPMAFLAALFGGTGALALSEAGNTMADLTLALLSVSSLAFALSTATAATNQGRRWRLALAAGLAGAGVGMKLTVVITLPLLLMVALLGPSRPSTLRVWLLQVFADGSASLLAFALSLCLFASPQVLLAHRYTGNPVYPLFNQHFRSPLHEDAPSSEERFLPDSPAAFVLAPLFEFTDSFYPPFNPEMDLQTRRSEVLYRDPRSFLWALATLALLLLPSWRRGLSRPALALVLGLAASYISWLALTAIGRYAIPLQLLQGLVIGLACKAFVSRLSPGQGRWLRPSTLFAALLSLVLVSQVIPSWGRTSFDAHWTMLRSATGHALVPLREGRLQFPEQQPVVLLDRPIGWIKAHTLPSHNPLLHWDPGIASRAAANSKLASVQERLERQLLASGFDDVLVLSLAIDSEPLHQRLKAFLAEAPLLRDAGFQPGPCSSYEAVSGPPGFSLCRLSRSHST